jgi:hypothetical protein|tara:strand:- start:32918 stop:34588 length:1671 start_codon:yes stop_codon:yes gene_type:complete
MRYALNLANFSTVDSAIRSIPRWNVTELDLRDNLLSTKKPADILRLIQSIPPNISTLNLTNTGLGRMLTQGLIELLSNIPAHITTLILTNNGLSSANKSDDDLIAIFSVISERTSVHTLELACNTLGTRDNPEIFNALKVNTVNLRRNDLWRLSPATLVAILQNHHAVHLGDNELTSEQLYTIAAAQINTLKHLDLRTNRLNRYPEALRALTSSLPALKTLGLTNNELGAIETAELTSLVQTLPISTEKLDLSNNTLWRHRARGLRAILLAMQTGVTTLMLDNNELHSVPYLVSALEVIPTHIKKLSLDRNYWGYLPLEAFLAVIGAIPEHVTAISLRNNGLSRHPRTLMRNLKDIRPNCDLDFSNNGLTHDVENTMIALTSASENTGLKALGNDPLLTIFSFLIPATTTIRNDFFLMTDILLAWKPIRENGRITNMIYTRAAGEIDQVAHIYSPTIAPHEDIARQIPRAPSSIMPAALHEAIRFFSHPEEPTNPEEPTSLQTDAPHFWIDLLSHPVTPAISLILLLTALITTNVVVAAITGVAGTALLFGHLSCH